MSYNKNMNTAEISSQPNDLKWYPLTSIPTDVGCQCFVIYCIRHKSTGKEYVGQTKNEFASRIYSHVYYAYRKKTSYMLITRMLSVHGIDDFEVCILEKLENRESLDEAEIRHINERRSYVDGYNLTKGGDGFKKDFLPEWVKENLKKPVCQYTKDDVLIATYDSINAASNATGISCISFACSGRTKTAGGFKWKFANDDHKTTRKWSAEAKLKYRASGRAEAYGRSKQKQVEKFDLTSGQTIEIFHSVKSAIEVTGVKNISMVCRGVRKHAGGFGWRYLL